MGNDIALSQGLGALVFLLGGIEARLRAVERGAEVAILGCTELPLLLAQNDDFRVAGKSVVLLDPTEILARKCVALSSSVRR